MLKRGIDDTNCSNASKDADLSWLCSLFLCVMSAFLSIGPRPPSNTILFQSIIHRRQFVSQQCFKSKQIEFRASADQSDPITITLPSLLLVLINVITSDPLVAAIDNVCWHVMLSSNWCTDQVDDAAAAQCYLFYCIPCGDSGLDRVPNSAPRYLGTAVGYALDSAPLSSALCVISHVSVAHYSIRCVCLCAHTVVAYFD